MPKNNDTENKENSSSTDRLEERNKIMRDNSLDIATLVAYRKASKVVKIKEKKNIVIATTLDNELKVGDEILKVDDINCNDISDIKKLIMNLNILLQMKLNI